MLSSAQINASASLIIVGGGTSVSFENAHKVSIYSEGNDSASGNNVTFTIRGTDATGASLTETLVGATAGNTVTSTNLFKTVTSISPDKTTFGKLRLV